MNVKDFAKYVIDNIGRASLVNALNITNNFTNNTYDVNEFFQYIQEYVMQLLNNKQVSPDIAYRILNSIMETKFKYNSEIKYNLMMLIDSFIVELWEIFNGIKNT